MHEIRPHRRGIARDAAGLAGAVAILLPGLAVVFSLAGPATSPDVPIAELTPNNLAAERVKLAGQLRGQIDRMERTAKDTGDGGNLPARANTVADVYDTIATWALGEARLVHESGRADAELEARALSALLAGIRAAVPVHDQLWKDMQATRPRNLAEETFRPDVDMVFRLHVNRSRGGEAVCLLAKLADRKDFVAATFAAMGGKVAHFAGPDEFLKYPHPVAYLVGARSRSAPSTRPRAHAPPMPESPWKHLYTMTPENRDEIRAGARKEADGLLAKLKDGSRVDDLTSLLLRQRQAGLLLSIVQAWSTGEVGIVVRAGRADPDFEKGAWQPMFNAMTAGFVAWDELVAVRPRIEAMLSDAERARYQGVLQTLQPLTFRLPLGEQLALLAKLAGRADLVGQVFEFYGGKLGRYDSVEQFMGAKQILPDHLAPPASRPATPATRPAPVSPAEERAVRDTIERYWQAVESGDYDTISGLFMTPVEAEQVIRQMKKMPVVSLAWKDATLTCERNVDGTLSATFDPVRIRWTEDRVERGATGPIYFRMVLREGKALIISTGGKP